jgi:PAS domain S-box-containing protein
MITASEQNPLTGVIRESTDELISRWLTEEIMAERGPVHRAAGGARVPVTGELSEFGEMILQALATGNIDAFRDWLLGKRITVYSDRLIHVASHLLISRVQAHVMTRAADSAAELSDGDMDALHERSSDVMAALFDSVLKSARDAMPSEAADFQEMAAVLRDTLYSTLIGGLIRYISPSIEPLTGHGPDDFLDDQALWSSLILNEDLETFRMLFSEAIHQKESMEAVYRVRNVQTHRVHHVLDRVTPVIGPHGEVIRLDGILIDITDRIESETRLERAEQLRILGQLARDIAHDFNNLLVSILGHTDLMLARMKEDNPAVNELRLVARAAEKGARLTERLLAFARGSSSAGTREHVRLDEVARETIELARPSAPRHIELRLESPPSIPLIHGNPTSLSEALLNLILNGIHACTEGQGTSVTLKISDGDEDDCRLIGATRATVLEIIDDGHGMSDEVKMRVFEPLFTTRASLGGTGLGCALAFGVAIEHGGVLEVDSVENLGTTFTLVLPANLDTEVETEPMTPVVGLQHTGREGPAVVDSNDPSFDVERHGPRILAVDDDPNAGRLVKDLLEGAGYRVTSVEDGERALGLLEESGASYDLLILDVMMHPMDGTEIFTRAAKLCPDLPVLFCSGYLSSDRVSLPKVLDDATMMAKPFRAAKLFEMVRAALAGTSQP